MPRNRSDRIADLGELQLQVLDALTQLEAGSVYDVLDQFPESQRPRYTTVLTVLRGLERKGLVTHSAADRAFIFRLTVEAGRVRGRLLGEVLDRAFGGSHRDLMATLLDSEAMTPKVLGELKALIAEREAGGSER